MANDEREVRRKKRIIQHAESFRQQIDREPYRRFTDVGFGNVVTWGDSLAASDQACTIGAITTDQGDWGFEIHAVSENDT